MNQLNTEEEVNPSKDTNDGISAGDDEQRKLNMELQENLGHEEKVEASVIKPEPEKKAEDEGEISDGREEAISKLSSTAKEKSRKRQREPKTEQMEEPNAKKPALDRLERLRNMTFATKDPFKERPLVFTN
jgi:hypothetical protein